MTSSDAETDHKPIIIIIIIINNNNKFYRHTVEVSTLGLASDTKDFTSATKLPDIPNSLWHSVTCQALSSSFGIYCTRNSCDDPN